MKKLLLISAFALTSTFTFAQEEAEIDSLEGWTTTGKITFLLNQTAFSNWDAGGDNSLSASIKVNYDFN
ncbi:MAG: DUF3078 domain-containing protein, partial [Urechidicola sp.]|nr:DUF3078 domain-containing protein [Urechidicola sp.]